MGRAATVVAWFTGLGFGMPGVYGLWFFADRGYVWTFLGFPTYGEQPFEDWGSGPRFRSRTALVVGALTRARA